MTVHHVVVPSRKVLRSFGFLLGGAFSALWLYRLIIHGDRFVPFLVLAGVLVVLGALHPALLARPYRAWMWIGERIGTVTSRVILATFYVLILTPIAAIRRMVMRDPLELRQDLHATSYFHEKRVQAPSQFERMF